MVRLLASSSAPRDRGYGSRGGDGPERPPLRPRRRADQSITTVGDVVVTARRREEAVRDVPSTITALSVGTTGSQEPDRRRGRPAPDRSRRPLQRPAEREPGRSLGARFGHPARHQRRLGRGPVRQRRLCRQQHARRPQLQAHRLFRPGPHRGAGRPARRALRPQLRVRHRQYRAGQPAFRQRPGGGHLYRRPRQVRLEGVVNQKISDNVAVRLAPRSRARAAGSTTIPTRTSTTTTPTATSCGARSATAKGPLDVTLMVDAQDMNLPTFANQWVVPAGKDRHPAAGLYRSALRRAVGREERPASDRPRGRC
jgi:iron complex outermembrane receptor protein